LISEDHLDDKYIGNDVQYGANLWR